MLISVAPLLRQPVGERMTIEIAEKPVDPRGENRDLLEAGVRSIEAVISATHTDPGVYFDGTADAGVTAQCARCLRPIETPVRTEFAEQYYATLDVMTGGGRTPAPMDAKTIGSDFRVDLTPLLLEEIIIAAPFAPLCRPDCRGLCDVCGEDLNERPHTHEDPTDPRWAKLKELEGFRPDRE